MLPLSPFVIPPVLFPSLPLPPLPPPYPLPVGLSMSSSDVESVGKSPTRYLPGMVPTLDSPSPASLFASPLAPANDPAIWPVLRVLDPLVSARWSPQTPVIDGWSDASTTTSDPYWALNPKSWFTLFLMPKSLQPKAYHINTPVGRILKHSHIEIRPHALRIHPFASRHEYLIARGSAALPRDTSSIKVCVAL